MTCSKNILSRLDFLFIKMLPTQNFFITPTQKYSQKKVTKKKKHCLKLAIYLFEIKIK